MSDDINPTETGSAAAEPTPDGGELVPPSSESTPAALDPAFEALQKERDELYDRLLRKTAEFDNFRKRVERDRKEMIEWAAADVFTDLLAVLDDLDRALGAEVPPGAQAYKAGVELIHRQLSELLKKRGVTPIEALGSDFDPHFHQAIAYEESPGARDGEVIGILAKGYRLGDRLLRPALVKVAKAS
jgi:molecular chaperone GrpE